MIYNLYLVGAILIGKKKTVLDEMLALCYHQAIERIIGISQFTSTVASLQFRFFILYIFHINCMVEYKHKKV